MIERIGAWLAGRASRLASAIPMHPPLQIGFGPGVGHQPSAEVLLKESIGIADRSTRAIANRIASLTPQVKSVRRLRDGTVDEEILDDHPLAALLDQPHPDLSGMQLLRLTTQWVVTVGEAYWLKVGSALGRVAELHPIIPSRVAPFLRENRIISYSVTAPSGQRVEVPARDMVRFYWPDPEFPWLAEGYLGPNAITADALKFSGQTLRRHYESDGTPKTVLKAGADAVGFTSEERKRFNDEWARQYNRRTGSAVGVPATIPTGFDLIELAAQTGAELVPLLDHWRDDQLSHFGVPRSILGQVVSGDRSSAETNAFVFDLHTVLPIATLIADSITRGLARDYDKRIKVEFEEFVSSNEEVRLKEEDQDLRHKVRSINLVRTDRGLDPVPWGEEPIGTFADVPYDPDAVRELRPDNPMAFGDEDEPEGDEPEGEPEEPRTRAQASIRAAWEAQLDRERRYVPPMTRALRSILREQRASTLENLAKQGEPRARAIDPNALFDPEAWDDLFRLQAEPIRIDLFRTTLGVTLEQLGITEFQLTPRQVEILREQGAALIKHANRTTQRRIAAAVAEGVEAGEGIPEIAKRIRSVFDRRRDEARTIARTEVHKAGQAAQVEGFTTGGVERKRWNSSMDSRVRDSHQIDGQVVMVNEPFRLDDGELADAPGVGAGGASLSANNSINCRCFVTPVV